MANVKEIEWQGEIYNIADNVARGEAETAYTLASTAQTSANTAQSTADNAQTSANTAQSTANAAQTTADAAQDSADEIATQFTNYKKLETRIVPFNTQGFVIFQKRGNVCEISIAEPDASSGAYNVPIPAGFEPVRGTSVGGLPLTWGEKSYGYWIVQNGVVSIHIVEAHSITATHSFLI